MKPETKAKLIAVLDWTATGVVGALGLWAIVVFESVTP